MTCMAASDSRAAAQAYQQHLVYYSRKRAMPTAMSPRCKITPAAFLETEKGSCELCTREI